MDAATAAAAADDDDHENVDTESCGKNDDVNNDYDTTTMIITMTMTNNLIMKTITRLTFKLLSKIRESGKVSFVGIGIKQTRHFSKV